MKFAQDHSKRRRDSLRPVLTGPIPPRGRVVDRVLGDADHGRELLVLHAALLQSRPQQLAEVWVLMWRSSGTLQSQALGVPSKAPCSVRATVISKRPWTATDASRAIGSRQSF
jgi:hypothetical protein